MVIRIILAEAYVLTDLNANLLHLLLDWKQVAVCMHTYAGGECAAELNIQVGAE